MPSSHKAESPSIAAVKEARDRLASAFELATGPLAPDVQSKVNAVFQSIPESGFSLAASKQEMDYAANKYVTSRVVEQLLALEVSEDDKGLIRSGVEHLNYLDSEPKGE